MRRQAKLPGKHPVFEHIVTDDEETFLWRLDDYPWERNVWNIHPEYEIHLVRNAAGIALVGDHIGSFEPGHLTIVGSGLPHDWVTSTQPGELIRGRDIVVQFHPDRLRQAGMAFPEIAKLEPFLALAMRGLAFHGETRRRGAALMEAMGEVSGLERLALFLQLLCLLATSGEHQVLSSEDFAPDTAQHAMDSISRALVFIVDNFRHDIRLTDLARLMDMSEWACSRFFKKNSGNSFSEYLTMLRISEACKLLADSDLPITDICFEVGYSNVSNFNRVFRARRGMTPSAYRRLAKHRVISAAQRTAGLAPPVAPR
ncbi:AraC family transcriptional regulator [Labrys wisconsinensis]|uniref:AraC-like DNA-binding protein n=1 Tax=Labrys wisconsinensis TaxID=425677 RepID=A0ABU0J8U0_9HYPH|nr:AraC family transcriptional regulator [Labrys wisconsinensis]MDQ0470697.1 AraC-like DNA-binding protein [Labrys wisconsinensis]